jgi:uncharacterized protein
MLKKNKNLLKSAFLLKIFLLGGVAFGVDSSNSLESVEKVLKNCVYDSFKPTVVKTKYLTMLEGNEPLEVKKNEAIGRINTKGKPIENLYQDQKSLQKSVVLLQDKPKEVKDERYRVQGTDVFPNTTNVFMEMVFGTGHDEETFNGSGVMIGPRHVLTAGHNLYDNDRKRWVNHVKVSPGANGNQARFGSSGVIKAFVPKEYHEGKDKSDLAVLVLEYDLGKYTGWASVQALNDSDFKDTKFYVSGYPGDKQEVGQLWEMKGNIDYVEKEVLNYKIATYAGQSGSPLWRKSEPPVVVGIHVRGEAESNQATRISKNKFDWIVKCVTDNNIDIDKIRSLRISAEKGDKSAQNQLQTLAEQGDASAQFGLGLLYENQYEDYKKAEEWYLKAANQGHANAQYNLGLLYKNQYKNYEEAKKWYQLAANQGHANAQYNLGTLYYSQYKDYKKAEEWYLKAANQGDSSAQNNLGYLYHHQYKNYEEAKKWYLKACDQGDSNAQNNLGMLYENQYKNYEEAKKWYLKACDQGDAHAQNALKRLEKDCQIW